MARAPRKPRKPRKPRAATFFGFGRFQNWAIPWGALASPIAFPPQSAPFFLRSAAISGTFTGFGGTVAFVARVRDGAGNILGVFGTSVPVAGAGDTYSAQLADSLPSSSFLGGSTFTCAQGTLPPSLLISPQMTLDFFLALTTAGQTVDGVTVVIEHHSVDTSPAAVAP